MSSRLNAILSFSAVVLVALLPALEGFVTRGQHSTLGPRFLLPTRYVHAKLRNQCTVAAATSDDDEDELGFQEGDFKSGFVSILGNPNVGKSTLMNALLGEKLCIVSPKPQTTRHRILGVITEDKYQLVFSDTPGMVDPVYKLQETMMETVRGAVGDADVIVVVSDVYGEPLVDKKIMQKLEVTSKPILIVVNKMDLLSGQNKNISDYSVLLPANATKLTPPVFANVDADISAAQRKSVEAEAEVRASKEEEDSSGGGKPSLKRKLFQRKLKSASAATTATSVKPQVQIRTKEEIFGGPADSSAADNAGEGDDSQPWDPAWEKIFKGTMPVVAAEGDGAEASGSSKSNSNKENSGGRAGTGTSSSKKWDSRDDDIKAVGGADSRKKMMANAKAEQSKPKTLDELTQIWAERLPRAELVPMSAMNNIGVKTLLEKLLTFVPQGPKYFSKDTLTTRDERFFTTEIIREAIFLTYKDEIPYSCEVMIEQFKDKSPDLSVIDASIVVNKDSQKGILIGKGGEAIKALGIVAREKLEEFLRRKVFLSLRVRVDEDWRQNDEALTRYGYIESDFS